MTRGLLAAVGELHAPLLVKLTLALLACVLLPITLGFDALGWLRRKRRIRRALSASVVRCPRGHRVQLEEGTWTCTCKFVFAGHAWTPCPSCGAVGAITCPCGLTIPSPLEGLVE